MAFIEMLVIFKGLLTISWFTITYMATKCDDPDEIPRSAALNQGQHSLLLSGIRGAMYKWVYIINETLCHMHHRFYNFTLYKVIL